MARRPLIRGVTRRAVTGWCRTSRNGLGGESWGLIVNGTRNPTFERDFLKEAERLAGLSGGEWSFDVADRLQVMERTKGSDAYLGVPLQKLVSEIEEEGLDLGGWPVLAALASYTLDDEEQAAELRSVLIQIASYGPLVHQLCAKAREILT